MIVSLTILPKLTLTLTDSYSWVDSDPNQPVSLFLINEVAHIETNYMSACHYAVILHENIGFQDNINSETITLKRFVEYFCQTANTSSFT